MTALARLDRATTAAELVRRDYSVAERLAASDDPELRQFGERALATLNGETGLTRTLVPMESERSPATISRFAERDRYIALFAERYFLGQPMATAAHGIKKRLLRYASSIDWQSYATESECPRSHLGKPSEQCWKILRLNDGVALSERSIRRILAGHECAYLTAKET